MTLTIIGCDGDSRKANINFCESCFSSKSGRVLEAPVAHRRRFGMGLRIGAGSFWGAGSVSFWPYGPSRVSY